MNENILKKEVEDLNLDEFTSVKNLKQSCDSIPKKPGVYVVLGSNTDMPEFLKKGVGPEHHYNKKKDKYTPMNYHVDKLKSKWVDDTNILYIGKTDDTLYTRISTYINFGMGKDVAHRGGRAIWQLPDSDNLLIGWKTIEAPASALKIEKDMLKAFKIRHNDRLPFANWKE